MKIKSLIILFGILLINIVAFGQTRSQQRINAGDELYEQRLYQEAADVYERILRREDSPDIVREVAFKLGESHRRLLNYEEAKNWYQKALNLGYDDPFIYMHLSEMTLGLEEFDNSIEYAERFLEYEPDNDRGLKFLESAKYSKEHYDRETMFEVSHESGLSSEGEEWGVAYLENYVISYEDPVKFDEQFDIEIRLFHNNIIYWALRFETPKDRIVFSSTRRRDDHGEVTTEEGFSNIYQVLYNQQQDDWDPPTPVRGGINSDYYDGFLAYNENEQVGYFMNCGGFEGERETCDIYKSDYDANTDIWGEAVMIDYNSDDYNIGYPSINQTGDVLYFASDNPDGYGGYDIYKIVRDEHGYWGEPQNLGDVINTPFNDAYPYIAGETLYFSSFGHPGMGGFDIFYSNIDDDGDYSEPHNMGSPINSSADDFGFIINDDYSQGFFSSNRPGGFGNDDLYSFNVVSRAITIKGFVSDQYTGEPLDDFEFYVIGDDDSFYTANTDNRGFYELEDVSTDVNYDIEAFHEDYEDFSEQLLVRDQLISSHFEVITEYEMDLELTPKTSLIAEEEDFRKPEEDDMTPVEDDSEIVILEEEDIDEELPEYLQEDPEEDVMQESPEVVREDVREDEEDVTETFPVTPELDLTDYDLPTIYFDFAKYQLKPYSKKQLDTVAEFMKANPEKSILVHAHTDEIAGHLVNFYLSQKRAHSAIDYLNDKGIDDERLYPVGHGKINLVVENAQTDKEHQLNRRADFEPKEGNEFQSFVEKAPKHSFRYLNSLTKDVYFANGIEFMVQFVATLNPVHPQYYQKIMDKLPRIDIIYYYDVDLFHRYLAGSFNDFRSAYNVMRTLREMGYDTYIVAFNNGDRISVSLAQSLAEGH